MTPRRCAGTSASATGASPPRKKGRRSRQDQAREGYEVDAFGRWRGYSAGSTLGLGQSERDQTPRADARRGPGEPYASTGTAAVETGSAGAGPRLRQQRPAGEAGRARDRTDHPGAEEP